MPDVNDNQHINCLLLNANKKFQFAVFICKLKKWKKLIKKKP